MYDIWVASKEKVKKMKAYYTMFEMHIDEAQEIIDFKGARKTAIKKAQDLVLKNYENDKNILVEVFEYSCREYDGENTDWELEGDVFSNWEIYEYLKKEEA